MEALRGAASLSPTLKLVSEKYYGDIGLLCRRRNYCVDNIHASFPHKHVSLSCFCKPLQKKRHIFSLSSLSSSDTQMQSDVLEGDTEAYDITNQSIKTVRVRFQLQRECSFGQQFHIIGDDPMLGQWDPSGSVPFNWSDGHVWTTELDIPIEKYIKFKIILKEGPENIVWQPGPDRILQTWETENTITVCEDWDKAERQKILEEESTVNQIDHDLKKPEHNDTSNTTPAGRGLVSNANENLGALSDADLNMLMFGGNGSLMNVKDSELTTDETLSTNGLPVLVADLNSLQTTEEKPLKEVQKNAFSEASIEADEFKELNMPELKLEKVLDNVNQEKHQHVQVEDQQHAEVEVQTNSKLVDLVLNFIQRYLHILLTVLANFGFQYVNR